MRCFATIVLGIFLVGIPLGMSYAIGDQPAAKSPEAHEEIHDLKIGDSAPDFSIPGIDGKTHTLAYKDAKILVIAFISNHCPDSHAAQPRIEKLVGEMKGKSFAIVGINPNNPDGVKALDPQWPGGFPHTVLVSPEGEIIWRHNGAVDGEELRAKVLEYPPITNHNSAIFRVAVGPSVHLFPSSSAPLVGIPSPYFTRLRNGFSGYISCSYFFVRNN